MWRIMKNISIRTTARFQMVDITDDIRKVVRESGDRFTSLMLAVPGGAGYAARAVCGRLELAAGVD